MNMSNQNEKEKLASELFLLPLEKVNENSLRQLVEDSRAVRTYPLALEVEPLVTPQQDEVK
jgi:hypothetical protein